jgi:hypothetical protein
MESGAPVPPTRTSDPRRALAWLGYALLAGWVIATLGLFLFSVAYYHLLISGSDLLVVVAVAVLVPLFVYSLWRLLVRILAGLGRGGRS